MNIEFGDGSVVRGIAPLNTRDDIPVNAPPGNQPMVLLAADYWPTKTNQPIPAGGVVTGWYWSVFKDVTIEEMRTGKGTAVVEFSEVANGAKHVLKRDISGAGLWIAPNLP